VLPLAKIAFLFFCYLPQTKGATVVYTMVVDPAYFWLQKTFINSSENEKQN